MTRIVVKELIWDDWNLEHIKKHNVTVEEALNASKQLIAHKKAKKGRYALFGRSGTRLLTIIVKREEQKSGMYYVVTARDAARKERKRVYEKEKQNT